MPSKRSSKPVRGQQQPQYTTLADDLKRQAGKAESRRAKQKPGVSSGVDRGSTTMATLTLPTADMTTAPQQQPQAQRSLQQLKQVTFVPAEGPRFGTAATDTTAPSKPGDQRPKSPQRAANSRRLMIAVPCCVAVLLAVVVVDLMFGRSEPNVHGRTCETEGCHRYSKALLNSMDMSVDPCQDFGRYMCGRYSHPKNFCVLQNASLIATGQNELQRTWRFYKSCEDVMQAGTDNVAAVVAVLEDVGIHWPTASPAGKVDVLRTMVILATQMGRPSIFGFVVRDEVARGKQVRVNPSHLRKAILRRRWRLLQNKTVYSQSFDMLVRNFRRDSNTTASEVTFEEMMNIEDRHFNFTAFENAGGPLVSFQEVGNRAIENGTRLIRHALSQYRHWRTLMFAPVRFLTNSLDVVRALLNSSAYAPRDVELVLGWHVVQYAAPATNRELATAYHSIGAGAVDAEQMHKRFCFYGMLKYFGVASLTLFVRERFTEPVRRDVEAMARSIRRTYFSTLTETTYAWASLNGTLGFLLRSQSPHASEVVDDIGDIHMDAINNWRTVTLAYANIGEKLSWLRGKDLLSNRLRPFVSDRDTAILPSGITFPYYLPDVPAYLRYGTFATSMARVTATRYWSFKPKVAAAFQRCCTHSAGWSPPPSDVQGSSAIEAASVIYAATAKEMSGSGDVASDASSVLREEELPLPGLEHLSPRQLFYVSSCYLQCTDGNIPVNCNTTLRWSGDFAEAFKCAPGSPMLYKDPCRMFAADPMLVTAAPKRL